VLAITVTAGAAAAKPQQTRGITSATTESAGYRKFSAGTGRKLAAGAADQQHQIFCYTLKVFVALQAEDLTYQQHLYYALLVLEAPATAGASKGSQQLSCASSRTVACLPQ
jgi:hypothetical protein